MIVFSNALTLSPSYATGADDPLIGWRNVVTPGTVSATGADANYPAVNLANPSTALRWKGLNTADQFLTVGVSQVEPIDYVAVAGHNFGSGAIPVTVEGATAIDTTQKVLLHFDGADAGTTITDDNAGGSAHTWTANGNAQIDTAQFKFGTAALLLDGTGDYVSTPDHADFALGAGAFTIELQFSCNVAGGTLQHLAGQCDSALTNASTSFRINRTTGNVIQAVVCVGGTAFTVTGTTQFTNALNTGFHHARLVRTGNILRLFIDGVQEGGDVAIAGTVNDSSNQLAVGRAGECTTNNWTGWIDEFAMFVGVAKATANFPAPSHAYDTLNWSVVVEETLLADDSPALFRFTPQSLLQLRLMLKPDAVVPQAAVLYVGTLLVLQRRIYVGHTPISYGRRTQVANGRSENGQYLGRIVTGSWRESAVSLQNLTPAWYRASLDPFIAAASQDTPFFFAWRPASYPREVGFAWLTNEPRPNNARANGMMSIDLSLEGVA